MNQMISARTLRVLRIVGVVYMLLAIAYLVMPLDLDRVGWMGYIDDFFLNGGFQKAGRAVIRRQLFLLSSVFFVLCSIWILILTSID